MLAAVPGEGTTGFGRHDDRSWSGRAGNEGAAPRPAHRLRHARHVDADPRFDHRQRGAALHAGQPVDECRRDHLGADLLRHRLGDHDRPGRLDGRSASAARTCSSPAWSASPSPRCCAARPQTLGADRGLPHPAGHLRRRPGAAVAGHHARHLPVRAARPGDGDLRHRHHGRPDHGPDARRLPHRHLQLALGVLRQPAVRRARGHRADAVHAEDPAPPGAEVRLDRLRRAGARRSARCS